MQTVKTVALMAIMSLFTANIAWAVPTVSNVTMEQRDGTRIVEIGYTLTGEASIVTVSIETNSVTLPDSAVTQLSGDVCKVVQPGNRSFIWNAGLDWPENVTETAKARVTAWSIDAPPQYCVVDLSAGSVANSYPVFYYPSAEALPNGVTNDLYKTTRLLLRKITSTGVSGFMMGSQNGEVGRFDDSEDFHNVTLTKDFYVGVFQVTQGQWQQVMNGRPSKYNHKDYWTTRPVESVSYSTIRGLTDGAGWPVNNDVDANSFMGLLRDKTGLEGFDLPTEAQWEYACRAGTDRALNVPLPSGSNLTSTHINANMNLAGRYRYNGGYIDGQTIPSEDCTVENGTAKVGTYAPNAWGLYDMHGNVWEWCLDWYGNGPGKETDGHLGTVSVIDPRGANSGWMRVYRGGAWNNYTAFCRSAARLKAGPAGGNNYVGFRLVRNLP